MVYCNEKNVSDYNVERIDACGYSLIFVIIIPSEQTPSHHVYKQRQPRNSKIMDIVFRDSAESVLNRFIPSFFYTINIYFHTVLV